MADTSRVATEFTRQAGAMSSAPAFRSDAGLEHIVGAVGERPTDRVLDIACGPGLVAEAVAPHVGSVVGIDATPRMVELARARSEAAGHAKCAFQVAQAERLPFGDGTFDVAIARLALHHVPEPDVVLGEARRVLRADGLLVVADIVSSDDESEAAMHNALERLRDHTHIWMSSAAALDARVRAAGFELVATASWEQRRGFAEWAAIVNDPDRVSPIRVVMGALARAGQRAGLGLEEVGGELHFTHTWRLLVAQRASDEQSSGDAA